MSMQNVTIRVTPEQNADIEDICQEKDMTKSEVVRSAVNNFITENTEFKNCTLVEAVLPYNTIAKLNALIQKGEILDTQYAVNIAIDRFLKDIEASYFNSLFSS